MRVALALFGAALLARCGETDRESDLQALLRGGRFEKIAGTTVGDDRLEFWHAADDEPCFGPFVIVARDGSLRLIASCKGEFRSSSRPLAKDHRYCVLVASVGESGADAFFVYDSRRNTFVVHEAPEHVHDGFVIVRDRILFSSCKTLDPVWLVDLGTGKATSLGRGAPQAAEFHADGGVVLVSGRGQVYELAGDSLTPSRRRLPAASPATGAFDRIRIR